LAVSDVADLLVTVSFLVQSALLLWWGYSLHKCSKTIRRQADLIDAQQDLLRRQYHLLSNTSPESGWRLTEVSTNINHLPDEARIRLQVMLTELLQELHKMEH
jgi:hypothetical protein